MSSHDTSHDEPDRLRAAIRLVIRRYASQIRARLWLATPSLVLPGIGNIFVHYVPPLAIAHLLATLAHDSHAPVADLATPVILLAAAWLGGEALWRLAGFVVQRLECRAIGALYVEAMDDLFAKDAGFFHNNFAGSLTKRALGYARRFEDVFDVFAFSIGGNLFPLVFTLVVLARFSGWLIVVLLSMLVIAFICVRPLNSAGLSTLSTRPMMPAPTASTMIPRPILPEAISHNPTGAHTMPAPIGRSAKKAMTTAQKTP